MSEFHAGRGSVDCRAQSRYAWLYCRFPRWVGSRIAQTPSTVDQEGDAPDRRLESLVAHQRVWDYLISA